MELFKYRNLTLASFSFLITLFVSYYFNNTVRIAILVLTGVAFLSLVLTLAISRGKYGLRMLIRYTPSFILVLLALVLSLIHFDNSEIESYCDGKEHEITAVIDTVSYGSDSFSTYDIELLEIDGKEMCLWCAVSAEGGTYAALFNLSEEDNDVKFPLIDLEIEDPVSGFELWSGENVHFDSEISASVPTHGVKVYYFK